VEREIGGAEIKQSLLLDRPMKNLDGGERVLRKLAGSLPERGDASAEKRGGRQEDEKGRRESARRALPFPAGRAGGREIAARLRNIEDHAAAFYPQQGNKGRYDAV
jgi:hypothetical protein